MPRDNRKRPIYSKSRDDRRKFNRFVWKPHFLDILASRCTKDIEEAKRRVTITPDGKYKYTPSQEYIRYIKKNFKKRPYI